MNSTVHEPGPSGTVVPLPLHAVAAGVRTAVVTAAQNIREFLNVVFNLSAELNRMADEWEHTRPEQAARLREVARRGWDW